MSRRLLSVTIIVSLLATVGWVLPVLGGLVVEPAEWDFETVEEGESKTGKIIITNSGDEALKIEKVELPEGLSVKPDLANRELKPEEKVEVELSFGSEGIVGEIQQYGYIILTDSKIVPFTIRAKIVPKPQPKLRVTPREWNFGSLNVGESRERKFECENAGTADLEIEKVQPFSSGYQGELRVVSNISKEILAAGEKTEFILSLTGRSPGVYETDLYIRSNSAGASFTKLRIKGYMVSKPTGFVVSSDLSSVANNTPFAAEVTRTGKSGESESLTVEKDKREYFPRKSGPPYPHPADYTLTIKLVRITPPVVKPEEKKTPEEKPETKAEEEKPAGEKIPPAEKPSPELEEKKPEGEEKPAPKPGEEKLPEAKAPPQEGGPSAEPGPSEKPEREEEKKSEEPAKATGSGKEEPEKPSKQPPSKPEEKKPSEGSAAPASGEPEKAPGSEKPAGDSGKEASPGAK